MHAPLATQHHHRPLATSPATGGQAGRLPQGAGHLETAGGRTGGRGLGGLREGGSEGRAKRLCVVHRRSCRSEGAPGRCVQARFPVSTFHSAPERGFSGVSAINTPHPPDTRRSGRYGPPRALGGSGGALGKEGEEGLSGLPEGVAPWLGSPADGRLQLLLTLDTIRNMALVALALRLSGQRMQCVGWGCRSAKSAHAYRTQLAHTAPTTIP